MRPVRYLIPLILLLTLPLAASAGDADFDEISVVALKALMDSGDPVFLLNPLSDIEFNEQSIPGSVNVPLHEIKTTDKLPADRSTPIVTYCLGVK